MYGKDTINAEEITYEPHVAWSTEAPDGYRLAHERRISSLSDALARFERVRRALGHQVTLDYPQCYTVADSDAWKDRYFGQLRSARAEAIDADETGPYRPVLPSETQTGVRHTTCTENTIIELSSGLACWSLVCFRRREAPPLGYHGRDDLLDALGSDGEPGSKECRAANVVARWLSALSEGNDGPDIVTHTD